MEQRKKYSTKSMVAAAMFAAVLAVLSQLSIPMPSGVPVTLQTFAVALTAYVLGWKLGAVATLVYILAGALGIPVFANFTGGIGIVMGMTGGFIWGFVVLVVCCGLGAAQKKKAALILLSAAGLLICHLLGILQFMAVMSSSGQGMGFWEAALVMSVPYLPKDALSVAGAYVAALAVRRSLRAAGLAQAG